MQTWVPRIVGRSLLTIALAAPCVLSMGPASAQTLNDRFESFRGEVTFCTGEDVFVVRNAPDADVFQPADPDPVVRGGAAHLLSYVGVMGHQDGVEDGVRALVSLAARRRDWRACFVGDGPALVAARDLAARLGVADLVEFTGWQPRERVVRILASSDVCVSPEPASAYSDASTLIKIGEYLAMAKPVVCFALTESTYTAGPAAVAVPPGDHEAFAAAISDLLDDPERRATMGEAGRERITGELSRGRSEEALIEAYGRATALAARRGRRRPAHEAEGGETTRRRAG